jgi:hypothetical protein
MATTPETMSEVYQNLERRVGRLERGTTGGVIQTPEFTATLAVSNLVIVTTKMYALNDAFVAYLTLSWTTPVSDPNEIYRDPIKSYDVQYSLDSGVTWVDSVGTDYPPTQIGPFDPGVAIFLRVRASTEAGLKGDWTSTSYTVTTDVNAPDQPSTPSISTRLGQFIVVWDGKTVGGQAMPDDYAYTSIHVATTSSTFTATDANTVGTFKTGTFILAGLTYGVTYFIRLVAHDTSGNSSAASTAVTGTLAHLVDTDLIGAVIDGSHIIDDTINAADKMVAHSITANEMAALSIQAGAIAANAITADKIAAGSIEAQHLAFGVRSANLVFNPGFEDTGEAIPTVGDRSQVPGWTAAAGVNGPSVGFQYGPAFTMPAARGLGKCYLGNNGLGDGGGSITSDFIPIVQTTAYNISLRSYRYGGAASRLAFYIIYYDVNKTQMGTTWLSTYTPTSGVYTLLPVVWTAPSGAAYCKLVMYNAGVGVVNSIGTWICVDDITVIAAGRGAVEITESGVRMWDQDGAESINFSSVGQASNFATFGGGKASVSDQGDGSFQGLRATTNFFYKGTELQALLDKPPRGVVSSGYLPYDVSNITSEYGLFEAPFTCYPGRCYRLDLSMLTFPTGAADMEMYANIRYAYWGVAPTIGHPSVVRFPFGRNDPSLYTLRSNGILRNASDLGINASTGPVTIRLLVTAEGPNGPIIVVGGSNTRLYVTDVGPEVVTTATANSGGGNNALPPPPPPPPPSTVHDDQYGAVWARSYWPNNSMYANAGSKMYQGYYSSTVGDHSHAGFQDLTGILSGATINFVHVYFNFNHWYYNSGGTARIGYHNMLSDPGGTPLGEGTFLVDVGGWPKPGAQWVDVSSIGDGLKSGAIRGISLGRYGSTDKIYYGYADPPTLRINYTK